MQGDQLILQTNQPVMALGGFSGGDPILTVDEFAKLVQQGEVRYALVSSGNGFGGNRQSPITQWITAHGTVVPASDWGGTTTTSQFDGPFGGSSQLYQLSA
jgi:4-amino-4-deoxy-L-arabinose transferase-like glycosyltransferase